VDFVDRQFGQNIQVVRIAASQDPEDPLSSPFFIWCVPGSLDQFRFNTYLDDFSDDLSLVCWKASNKSFGFYWCYHGHLLLEIISICLGWKEKQAQSGRGDPEERLFFLFIPPKTHPACAGLFSDKTINCSSIYSNYTELFSAVNTFSPNFLQNLTRVRVCWYAMSKQFTSRGCSS
jgi:hypothetical protein